MRATWTWGCSALALARGETDAAEQRHQQRQAEIDLAWSIHSKPLYKSISDMRRAWLEEHLAAQNNVCAYCGAPIALGQLSAGFRRATIDHRLARSRGGTDTLENTVAACAECNGLKADRPVEELFSNPGFRRHKAALEFRSA